MTPASNQSIIDRLNKLKPKKAAPAVIEPKEKSSKIKLKRGEDPEKVAPTGDGWEKKQVGNKIIYTRSKTTLTAKGEQPSGGGEMTAEQKESQSRGRQNPNEMQYRGSESPSSETDRQKFVVKVRKEKSSSDEPSYTGKEKRESRRAIKVACKGDSKSRGGCAVGPRRISRARY
jgi:hypothetical protein